MTEAAKIKGVAIMSTVAKYDVVSDGRVSLDAGEAHDFPLETPGIRPGIRSLVSFMFGSISIGKSVEFRMLIANSAGIHEIAGLLRIPG
jgi:hypothetical protein